MPICDTSCPQADEIAVKDILAAMRQAGGYIDISPADALTLYRLAYAHAAARLDTDQPVAAIMTRNVVTIPASATVLDAAKVMAEAGLSGLPVLESDTVAGVISIKDLLRLLSLPGTAHPAALVARLLDPDTCRLHDPSELPSRLVAEVMSSPAVTVTPSTPCRDAAALMTARGINRLPVLEGTSLCGIVSRNDVVRSCHTGGAA